MDGVSVVIPCFNEEDYIEDCLLGIINNGFDKNALDILVVDGGSTDSTINIVNEIKLKFPCVRLLDNKYKKTPFALNIGVKNSKCNSVLIAGAHAKYPEGYISKLYKLIQREDIDVVGGAIETMVKNENKISKAICYVLSHPLGVGNSLFRLGAKELLQVDTVPFGLYRKAIFNHVGLYREDLTRNHDIELSKRILRKGYKIWMDPELKCTYYARENLRAIAQNNYLNGFWNLKTMQLTRNFDSLSIRHFVPLLFILSLIFPLTFLLTPWKYFALLSGGSMLCYLLVFINLSVRSKTFNTLWVFFAFITLHFSYGFGSLVGAISMLKFWK